MRVLFCSNNYPPDTGGIARFSHQIVCLCQQQQSVDSVCVLTKNKPFFEGTSVTYSFHSIRCFPSLIGHISRLVQMVLSCRAFKPDVVIASTWQDYGWQAIVLKQLFGFRVGIQVHGSEIIGRYASGIRQQIARICFTQAEIVLPNSEYTAGSLEVMGVSVDRIFILRPFVEPTSADEIGKPQNENADGQMPVIFTAASFRRVKGLDFALRSLARISSIPWTYEIAGSSDRPEDTALLKDLANELSIGSQVKILGELSHEQTLTKISNCSIYLQPSRFESFGIALLEAQLLGKPCVATRVGGVPEAVLDRKTGILVPFGEEVALSSAISKLLDDVQLREEMGKMGRERVQEAFTPEARHRAIGQMLERLK